jgi:hypothetical protein
MAALPDDARPPEIELTLRSFRFIKQEVARRQD